MSLDPRLWEALEAHGLTIAVLECFATFCAQKKVGSFTFHTGPGGRILAYEEHHKARVERLEMLATMEGVCEGKRKRS